MNDASKQSSSLGLRNNGLSPRTVQSPGAFLRAFKTMPAKPPNLPADLRPRRVTQVNAFLRQHDIGNVELRRHAYYFDFFGPPTYGWMTSSVLTDRLDSMSLGEWLAKYRELEKLNKGNALGKPVTKAAKGKKKAAGVHKRGRRL